MSVFTNAVIPTCQHTISSKKYRKQGDKFHTRRLPKCWHRKGRADYSKTWESVQNHDIRRLSNKKIESSHDTHRIGRWWSLKNNQDHLRKEYQNVSRKIGIALNPLLNAEAGATYFNFEVATLLKFLDREDIRSGYS